MSAERILVVDDEPGVRAALEGILRDEGFQVSTAASGEEGLEILAREPFDALLLDVWLPGIDGLDTLVQLRERRVDAEVVMISGHGTIETAVRATKLGAFDFVEKPLSLEKTLLVLRNALRQRRLERRNRRLMEHLERDTEILGDSAAAGRLRECVAAAASSDAPVLVCGERGTGRETLARRIHAASSRSAEAFVTVPCGALDAGVAGEALFGSTGRPGRIMLAERGTLFLEDADRLEGSVQIKLEAVLGRSDADAPDVRILASVEPEPNGLEVALRQRLEVLRIDVPALRERREDVPLFLERFLRDLSREYGRAERRFDRTALTALVRYDWPGNVRELRNLVERVLLLSSSPVISEHELPEGIGGATGPIEDMRGDLGSLAEGTKAFERYYVRRVFRSEHGDVLAAASRLGMAPDELSARLEAMGLRRRE